ncbi:hypothetical protein FOZ60_002609 [Perkinsus olseni]|uniref:Uncharacterized protein n=1 Tax=Perkinsus olseni TaxID=32597 RepID=A0A7J6NXD6_PEROL|nr:hypothetical protein FOZ60_002609 [Perkinsus olseni]
MVWKARQHHRAHLSWGCLSTWAESATRVATRRTQAGMLFRRVMNRRIASWRGLATRRRQARWKLMRIVIPDLSDYSTNHDDAHLETNLQRWRTFTARRKETRNSRELVIFLRNGRYSAKKDTAAHFSAWVDLISQRRRSAAAQQLYNRMMLQQLFTRWMGWSQSVVAAGVSLVIPRRRAAVESIFADWRKLRKTMAFARKVDSLHSLIDAGVQAKALRRWRSVILLAKLAGRRASCARDRAFLAWRKHQAVERWNSTRPRRATFDCLRAWRRWYKRQVARRRAAQMLRGFYWARLRRSVTRGWSSVVEYKKAVAEKGRLCRAGSGDSLDGRLLATAWRRWRRSLENIRELWREVETAITARFTDKRLAEVAAAWAGYVAKQKVSRDTLRSRTYLKPARKALSCWLQLTRAVALSRAWEAIRASRLGGRCLTIWSDFYRERRRCLQHAYEVRQKQRMRHFERWYRATRVTRVGGRVELILKWSKLLSAFNWWKDLSSGQRNQRSLRCLLRIAEFLPYSGQTAEHVKEALETINALGLISSIRLQPGKLDVFAKGKVGGIANTTFLSLWPRYNDNNDTAAFNTDQFAVKAIRNASAAGVDPGKIVLEVPLLARSNYGSADVGYSMLIYVNHANPQGNGTWHNKYGGDYFFFSQPRAVNKIKVAHEHGLHGISLQASLPEQARADLFPWNNYSLFHALVENM